MFCFALLSTSRLLFICLLDLCSALVCHLSYLLSSARPLPPPLAQCSEDCFPYHQLCFWFADCSSSNFHIFISSTVVLFVASVSFFKCQLPLISFRCLIISSLTSSSIDSLLITVYNNFLLCPVLSEEIVHWSFPCHFFLVPSYSIFFFNLLIEI